MEPGTSTSEAVTIEPTLRVLIDEYRMFWPDEEPPQTEEEYFRRVHAKGQAALCLSGGGIRSAAFALGVMQGLSHQGVLGKFHYASSVSGGGYINSWLQRWIFSSRQAMAARAVGNALAGKAPDEGQQPIAEVAGRLGAKIEPGEIRRLRENSNFITPRIGLASNDTWTALAMSIRNVATNWLLFGPLLLIVALLPNLFFHSVASIGPRAAAAPVLFYLPLAVGALGVAIACWNTVRAMPSYRGDKAAEQRSDAWHLCWIVLPLTLWAIGGTLAGSAELLTGKTWTAFLESWWPAAAAFPQGTYFALATLLGMAIGFLGAGLSRARYYRETFVRDMLVALPALAVLGFLILGAPQLFDRFAPAPDAANWRAMVLTVIGPLWLLGTHLAATIVFVALRSPKKSPRARPDDDREWLARLSAIKLKLALLWTVAGCTALLLNELLDHFAARFDMSLTAGLASLSGAVALRGGKSARTESGSGGDGAGAAPRAAGAASKVLKRLTGGTLISIATALFAILLLLLLARLEMRAIGPITAALQPWLHDSTWADPQVMAHALLLGALILLLIAMAWRIDTNRFSLNGLYRNRLARAFLGAARPERAPDPFTGFDAADNVRLHKLAEWLPKERVRLYPVINVALNVTATENLAWQERKAEPFIFSPLYSGSTLLDAEPARRHHERRGAFIATGAYGGRESDLAMEGTGVSLATAMSVSGAAASPNMGYHSSAATAFLMTLFNVRLGAWMTNPAVAASPRARVRESRPANVLRAVLSELAGSTDDRGRDIYLSDGGHFENLGLYEMLRRGCPFILVSDAGCDPDCNFSDLGNAVRKAKIDLNVDIAFEPMRIRRRGDGRGNAADQLAFALGTITYPKLVGDEPEAPPRTGQLLYLKPSYFDEDELPADVVSYAKLNAAFPHETTADQFFSESQFESYRKLGYTLALRLGPGADAKSETIAAFFTTARGKLARPGAPT